MRETMTLQQLSNCTRNAYFNEDGLRRCITEDWFKLNAKLKLPQCPRCYYPFLTQEDRQKHMILNEKCNRGNITCYG